LIGEPEKLSMLMPLLVTFAGTLALIIAEEVRDLRYFPLVISVGAAGLGSALWVLPDLVPQAALLPAEASVVVAATISGLVFFRDLRRVSTTRREAEHCVARASELAAIAKDMRTDAGMVNEASEEAVEAAKRLHAATLASLEETHHD
jgi:hypothetical protein